MIADADIAIVGAGVMGLALAYNLAANQQGRGAGGKRIVVVDGHTLAWGASGRNGGGVRQQWSTPMNVRLMQESMDICAHFAKRMRINVWMRRGGYLFLAGTQAAARRLERNVAVQNRCGLATEMITPAEARGLVPELANDEGDDRFVAACYNPSDGIVFPWPFLWGYAHAAAKHGVAIHTSTPVTAIERRGDGAGAGFRITTPAGAFVAERIVCAAGAWSPEVARLVGASLPNRPQRHEILSTEALKPFLKPMVTVAETGLYVSQSLRGELVGGISLPAEDDGGQVRLGSRLAFTTTMARALVALMPRLGHVKVVRQWAGPYDLSPDGDPIVGELPDVPGFHVVCGFRGHGFMMAPVVARHFAAALAGGAPHEFLTAWSPARFAAGAPPRTGGEEMFIG
jgi:sarcosine oxidase subunit beta